MKRTSLAQKDFNSGDMFPQALSKPVACLRNSLRPFKDLPVYPYGILSQRDSAKGFILFAQGRTGSTLLGSLLNSHPQIVFEDEILNIDGLKRAYPFPYLYTLGRRRMAKAVCYGYHVKVYQLSLDHKTDPKQYIRKAYADGWKILYLKRSNLLRHALSNIRAEMTRTYFHYVNSVPGAEAARALHVQPRDLFRRMEEREEFMRQEEKVLSGLDSYDIVYERDLLSPRRRQEICKGIFAYLGLTGEEVNVSTHLARINQGSLQELIANYNEIAALLRGTRFESFLDEGSGQ